MWSGRRGSPVAGSPGHGHRPGLWAVQDGCGPQRTHTDPRSLPIHTPRSVRAILDRQVGLEVESIDRLYLNAWVSQRQREVDAAAPGPVHNDRGHGDSLMRSVWTRNELGGRPAEARPTPLPAVTRASGSLRSYGGESGPTAIREGRCSAGVQGMGAMAGRTDTQVRRTTSSQLDPGTLPRTQAASNLRPWSRGGGRAGTQPGIDYDRCHSSGSRRELLGYPRRRNPLGGSR